MGTCPVFLIMALGQTPGFHEAKTIVTSLQDVCRGDNNSAKRKWEEYAEKSVFGSPFKSLAELVQGNIPEAERLGRNSGKALGEVVEALGFGSKLPVLHEVALAGKSLQHAAADDPGAANAVWHRYREDTVLGQMLTATVEAAQGRKEVASQKWRRSWQIILEDEETMNKLMGLICILDILDILENVALACLSDTLTCPVPGLQAFFSTARLVRQLRAQISSQSPRSDLPQTHERHHDLQWLDLAC